jgi:2-oxoglutarate dehydrogenase E2 component (dihydrolipoamide succinyltransferase)
MATDVVMPQMGESIAEGTIVRWMKKVGERVERDEPLFEISTDKVDAEIPAPAAGTLAEIRANEGDTVPVNTVVAVIAAPDEKEARAQAAPPPTPPPASAPAGPPPRQEEQPEAVRRSQPAAESIADAIRQRSSPLVRQIAKEHGVDISQIRGTGIAGRVTKDDILAFINRGGATKPVQPERPAGTDARVEQRAPAPSATTQAPPPREASASLAGQVVPMTVMRRKIAEHMIASRRTSAHVHSVFEVNFSRVAQFREAKKAEFERAGVKLTYLSFIVKAAVDALRAVPIVNASIDGDSIVYHKQVNVGIAVALDRGLIVPVVRDADEKNLLGLSRAIADLASRARSKQLKPDEVTGGTFTITNPGVFGALFGMPIINQPQLAILGVGNIEKRPIVIDDAIAIRPMGYLSLGYDHRAIDGAVAVEFLSHLKLTLESWSDEEH